MAQVELKNLSKKYGKVTAVQNMDLIIPHNQFLVLVGPSGCGEINNSTNDYQGLGRNNWWRNFN